MLRVWALCGLACLMAACDNFKVPVEDPNLDQEPLLAGVVLASPEIDAHYGYIFELRPVTAPIDYRPVSGARVRIEEVGAPDVAADFLYDPIQALHTLPVDQMPLEEGVEYSISISHGDKVVTGTSTVPQQVDQVDFIRIVTVIDDPDADDVGEFDMEIHDRAGEENSYHIGFFAMVEPPFTDAYPSFALSDWNREHALLTDEGRDGEVLKFTLKVRRNFYSLLEEQNTADPVEYRYEIVILTSDHNYHDYYSAYHDNENPIFSEPLTFPRQLEGGAGIFSTYRIRIIEVEDIEALMDTSPEN